ncbi:MAG: SPOR domain-containing protein [Candidatus Omnitrophota bacterium]
MDIKGFIIFLVFFISPAFLWAANLDNLKADFLQGNYRRVIFESGSLINSITGNDELNYILGLSYLKEGGLDQAQNYFKRILGAPGKKFKVQATLGLADTYLLSGRLDTAQDVYNKLIQDDVNSSWKATILYRLSQLEFKKGNICQGNDYLSKLRRDFPLSPELRLTKGLSIMSLPEPAVINSNDYSVQVGFFSNSTNANNFKDKLLSKDYPAYLEESAGGYRVKVGKFKTQDEALDLENKLTKEGFQTKVCP